MGVMHRAIGVRPGVDRECQETGIVCIFQIEWFASLFDGSPGWQCLLNGPRPAQTRQLNWGAVQVNGKFPSTANPDLTNGVIADVTVLEAMPNLMRDF